ncbi:MAG TPA: GlsB/YeaQ/YmgE family stress response membrane protein [Thermomicrobiales bacterium]|nr:GlsB/YeaQ/YmgE family stress response membrane protein [Thermomicrobiales bacterium]
MFSLEPGGLLAWIVVGILAGWIAGTVTRGTGFGCVTNIIIGLIGAFIGQLVLELLDFRGSVGFFGSIAVATFGAVILVGIANLARR